MTKQITVGYDGSVPSSEAVLWAAAEADLRGASLRIITCFAVPVAGEAVGGWATSEAYGALMEASRRVLAGIKDVVVTAQPGIEVVTEASSGPAALALVNNVDADDLIVVGSSSHHGASAFWLGSTPRHVVRHSPCPVVVVRGAASRGRPDRIVVGVDGSTASDRALRWAGDEADRHQVPLLIVHGWLFPYIPVDTTSVQALDESRVDAACLLDRAVEAAREMFAADITGQLVEGLPASALLGAVRDGDLLVVGSSGRGSLTANFFGSTVNKVLDECAVPVVVVRGGHDKYDPMNGPRTSARSLDAALLDGVAGEALLANGRPVDIVPAGPADMERVRTFYGRLSDTSSYYRFFGIRRAIPEQELRGMVAQDVPHHVMLLASIGDELIGIGEFVVCEKPDEAEVAFAVADDHHREGVATLLLERLAVIARRCGLKQLIAQTLPGNRDMLLVFRTVGLAEQTHFEGGVIDVTLDLSTLDHLESEAEIRHQQALANVQAPDVSAERREALCLSLYPQIDSSKTIESWRRTRWSSEMMSPRPQTWHGCGSTVIHGQIGGSR